MSISFTLNEDQEMIREAAHEFAAEVIRPAGPHHDETGEYPWEVLTAAWEAGLMNTHVPEEFGGTGMNNLDALFDVIDTLAGSDLSSLEAFHPRKYTEPIGGKSAAELGGEPILFMRHFQKEKALPSRLLQMVNAS